MPRRTHFLAGILAPLCIATFFLSTILVELFGTHSDVARLKSLVAAPGLWILVPLMAALGGSGMYMARYRKGRLVDAKKTRMPLIALNGLLVLVTCAIVLDHRAAAGAFDNVFYGVQVIELIAGAVNLTLMYLNARDGLRLAGRSGPTPPTAATVR